MRKIIFALLRYLPDKAYLQLMYYYHFGKFISWKHPETFSEKIQWLKVYDRNPLYTTLVDKIEVKNYVSDKMGAEYIIPTLGVWDSFDEIDFDKLPNQFVLKTNHSGGNSGVIICKDKNKFDIESARKKLTDSLNTDMFFYGREWPYKNVIPRIIAEEYMVDESGYELKDYKFFCFNGQPKFFKVDFDRQTSHRANYYDLSWNLLPFFEKLYPHDKSKKLVIPNNFDDMVEIARKLSTNIPFTRIDLYNVNGKVYFGEITFYPASGMEIIEPIEWDNKLGSWIKLPKK